MQKYPKKYLTKGQLTKGFCSLEKVGIVVIIGYAVFSCFSRKFHCSDTVVDYLNTLRPVTIDLLRFEHDYLLHELSNNLGIQFLDVCVLPYQ